MAFDKVVDSSVLDADLTKIADGIRTGTGQNSAMTMSEMPLAISEIDTTGYGKVPSYWKSAVNTAISTIRGLQEDPNNIPLFAYFSDCHYNPGTTPNPGHTGILAAAVMNACQIPYAVCCGDVARSDGNGLTSEDDMKKCFIVTNHRLAPIGWHRLLQTMGNHDGSWGHNADYADPYYCYQMDSGELYDHVFRKQENMSNHVFGGGDKSYFYVDDTASKIRIIMLNSLWLEDSFDNNGVANRKRMRTYGFGQAQLSWLANTALNFSEDGWSVILATHVPPIATYDSTYRDEAVLRGILGDFINATGGNTYTYGTKGTWDFVSVTSIQPTHTARVIGMFCGHNHRDTIDASTHDFPVITITSDANLSYDDNEEDRVYGTDNEHAIDFVTVNTVTQAVTLTRLGVGASRAYSYKGIALYAISNNLTNVSTSNAAASIEGDAAYTATLAALEGYEKLAVTVTMGGVDITSTAYSNGVVSIAKVTGDIVITASAAKKANYTNLADPSSPDWANGERLNSSGTTTSLTGSVVTNWIACKRGDILRIKGIDLTARTNTSNTSAPYISVDWETVDAHSNIDINSHENKAGVVIADGITTLTMLSWDGVNQEVTSNGEIAAVRFSGLLTASSADDVIITKNEPIE